MHVNTCSLIIVNICIYFYYLNNKFVDYFLRVTGIDISKYPPPQKKKFSLEKQ